MQRLQRLAAVAGAFALLLAGSFTSAHSAFAGSGVVGHVYVNLNTSPINTVAGFNRLADGSLAPISGSPFVAGGSGASVSSQGAIQLSSDGKYLLAVDAGSNGISVLKIKPDGSLRLAGAPVPSGGSVPVSIAVHNDLIVVGNDGTATGGANYTAFRLNAGGHLWPVPGSTFDLPSPTTIGDVIFSPDGRRLVGTRVDSSLIDSFVVSSDGQLIPASGSPYPAQGYGPFGGKFRPTNASQLYISNAHDASGGPAPGTVSAFMVSPEGTFSSIGASPYATNQIAACWIEISHGGQVLFSVNTGSNSVSSFSIAADGSLSLIGSTTLTGTASSLGALDAGIDPTDHFLYVVERGANALAGLRVNSNGSLTELPSSPTPLPAGSVAFGIVVN